jgi:hypothetical protein
MVFSNTCVDKICTRCADAHKLCRHCGGDSEMRTKRRNFEWAEVKVDIDALPQEALAIGSMAAEES